MVSAATEAAVSASISTPVGPVVSHVASIATPVRPAVRQCAMSIVTCVSASGWHSGMRSAVRLAAMMPAIRAVANTSPFFASPEHHECVRSRRHRHERVAPGPALCGGLLADVDHVRAWPRESTWVSPSGRFCRVPHGLASDLVHRTPVDFARGGRRVSRPAVGAAFLASATAAGRRRTGIRAPPGATLSQRGRRP